MWYNKCKEKGGKAAKSLHLEMSGMYKFDNGQISLEDFGQPVGMNLKNSNRWVKRAQTIPWIGIEKKYAKLFSNKKGNVAKSLRLGLGARIIQAEYGYSDAEIPLQIQENPYLQYFCGYKAFDDSKPPFDPSMMVYFRKRLTPEIIGEINEMIIAAEQAKAEKAEKEAAEYKRWKGFSVVVIDSCEYLIRTYSDRKHIGHHGYGFGYGYMAHKGNCKFCMERNKKK